MSLGLCNYNSLNETVLEFDLGSVAVTYDISRGPGVCGAVTGSLCGSLSKYPWVLVSVGFLTVSWWVWGSV